MKKIIRLTESDLKRIVTKIIKESSIENDHTLLPKTIATAWKNAGWGTRTGFWKIENGKLYCKIPTPARIIPWWKDWAEVSCNGEEWYENLNLTNESLSLDSKIKMYLNEIESSTKVSDDRTVTDFIDEVEKSNGPKVGRYKVENGQFLVKIDNPSGIIINNRMWVSLVCN